MKFSMNVFRHTLHWHVCALKEISEQIANGKNFDKDDFLCAVDDVITSSNILNCVYEPDDPDFSNMSELHCPLLSEVDE